MPGTEGSQQPTPETTPAASLADQYELGDETPVESQASTTPSVQSPVEDSGTGTHSVSESATPEKPRGPDGRFLPQSQAAETSPGPRHPSALVQDALDYGVPDEDISSYTTEQLSTVVRGIRKQVEAQRRDGQATQERQQAVDEGQQRATQARDDRTSLSGSGDATHAAASDLALPDDLTAYRTEHPALVTSFERLLARNQKLEERLAGLEKDFGQVRGYVQHSAQETMRQRCDRAFTKHEAVLGKGGFDELPEGDPIYHRRVAVLQLADRDKGKGTLEQKIDRAVKLLYGDVKPAAKPTAPAADTQAVETWNSAGLARPTQRNGAKEQVGVKAAEQSVANRLRDMSEPTESGTATDEDFL